MAEKAQDPIPKDLFKILACPICRADLRYSKDRKRLVCVNCGQKYPIGEGVPDLTAPKQVEGKK